MGAFRAIARLEKRNAEKDVRRALRLAKFAERQEKGQLKVQLQLKLK